MLYRFRCITCGKYHYKNIPMDKYDELKDKQICDDDGNLLERVIEWNGPANNLGGYSDVAGRAGWQS